MLRIGIVGSENSHTGQFARILNVTKALSGAKVVALWGEEKAHTEAVAEKCLIPEIVSSPEQMIGKIDAAIVDHRHAKYHVPAATPLVDAGIPVLVDKPFSFTVKEGRDLLALARKKKVLVTSYSCIRYAHGFKRLYAARDKMGKVLAADFVGPADIDSEYGGIFFYGIHQVEMMAALFGPAVRSVAFSRGDADAHTATVVYANGGPVVTLNLVKGYQGGFGAGLYGQKSASHERVNMRGLYLRGLEAFLRMVKTGRNDWTPEDLLSPVATLDALQRSIVSGKMEKLESFSL